MGWISSLLSRYLIKYLISIAIVHQHLAKVGDVIGHEQVKTAAPETGGRTAEAIASELARARTVEADFSLALERDGSDRVLKEPQLRHELARKQIRTRGENLAELHERRSEILQHPPEAPRRARRPGVRRLLHRLASSDEPEHTGPVEQVGEAVPRGDGRDLPEPVEVLEIQGVSPGCYHRNPPGVVGKTLAR